MVTKVQSPCQAELSDSYVTLGKWLMLGYSLGIMENFLL